MSGKREICTTELTDDLKRIRIKVFVEEQQFPLCDEFDDLDPICVHFMYKLDDEPVATCRLVPNTSNCLTIDSPKECSLGRLCVLADYRKQGIATELGTHFIQYCRDNGYTKIWCNAQVGKEALYSKLGFKDAGLPLFREAHCLHKILVINI